MVRKFLVVAIVSATSFVGLSSDSEAFHLRRARHIGHRHCATAPAPTCDTGCASYAATPVVSDCGCSTPTMGHTGYTHQGVYSGNMNSHVDLGANMSGTSTYGNSGVVGSAPMPAN